MKKILLLGTHRKLASGVSTHVNQLMESPLSSFYIFDHFVIGSSGPDESKITKINRYLTSPIRLFLTILKFQPEIVHLNPSMDFKGFYRDAVYLFISKILGRKVVFQLHAGLTPQEFFDKTSFLFRSRKVVLESADTVVLLTQQEAKHATGFCDFKRLLVIPNAIDVNIYEECLPKTYSPLNTFNIVYIGRLVETKGIVESILALAMLKKSGYSNFTYKIAGSGPFEQELKYLTAKHNLTDEVEFLGSIFGAEKIEFWRNANLLLFPTYFDEGLPYTLIEALASGTPSITTKIGGIPEIIEDNIQGVFVEPKNIESISIALRNMLMDPTLLNEMSRHCIIHARKQFSIERLVTQFTDVYENL